MMNVLAVLSDGRYISSQVESFDAGCALLREWAKSSWYTHDFKYWVVRGFIGSDTRLDEVKFVEVVDPLVTRIMA